MNPQRGFTLLELVVVVGIFGVFSVMAYGGLDSVLDTRAAVQAALDRTAQYQKAYMRLRNDFQQARNRSARDGYGQAQPALFTTQDGRLEFTRGGWRNPLLQQRSSLERVSYRLHEKKLLRETWRVLDRAQDSPLVESVLLERVDEVKWRFLDANNQWLDIWPASQQTTGQAAPADPPPRAVELVLLTDDWGELRFLFRLPVET